jgi:hypothetical protein
LLNHLAAMRTMVLAFGGNAVNGTGRGELAAIEPADAEAGLLVLMGPEAAVVAAQVAGSAAVEADKADKADSAAVAARGAADRVATRC